MMALPLGDAPKHFLHPCTLFVHREEHWVSTILGSCISVCLWDPMLNIGGINHFMLPLWNGEGLATPKYGNIAIEKLIEKLLGIGSRKDRMVAKLFGGARMISGDVSILGVGERNIVLAREILGTHGIQIVASEVGGMRGRKILFNTRTGSVLVAWLSSEDPLAKSLPDGRPKATLRRNGVP
jgi:chemotaxis protein CheD